MGSLSRELMPTEQRGDIYWIHPSGWQKNSGYERSHLIAFQLAGENDNELNLVTGTHFFNNDGMRPFEESVIPAPSKRVSLAREARTTGLH